MKGGFEINTSMSKEFKVKHFELSSTVRSIQSLSPSSPTPPNNHHHNHHSHPDSCSSSWSSWSTLHYQLSTIQTSSPPEAIATKGESNVFIKNNLQGGGKHSWEVHTEKRRCGLLCRQLACIRINFHPPPRFLAWLLVYCSTSGTWNNLPCSWC